MVFQTCMCVCMCVYIEISLTQFLYKHDNIYHNTLHTHDIWLMASKKSWILSRWNTELSLAKSSLLICYKTILAFSKYSPIIEPIEDGLMANIKESNIQISGASFSKTQDLNSEHVALAGVSDIHVKKVWPKIGSSCCDSDSDVHCIMSTQGGGPSREKRSPLNMHFMALRSPLKTLTGKSDWTTGQMWLLILAV